MRAGGWRAPLLQRGRGLPRLRDRHVPHHARWRAGRVLAGLLPPLPAPLPVGPHGRSGHLKTGATPKALARACGIDPEGFSRTLAHWNDHARRGEDRDFGRGATPYHHPQGGPARQPNPCIAQIKTGPSCAVRMVPGSLGTFAGLAADAHARALDRAGAPIPGLYVAGTDMASLMGGHYPAGGINLGPAFAFGHIAGLHAAGLSNSEPAP